jgi:hypothetical protein
MKIVIKILLVLSIGFFVLTVLKLLDAYTSLKYEIDEPRALDKISEAIKDKEQYIRMLIMWLWITLIYISLTIATLVWVITNKNRS